MKGHDKSEPQRDADEETLSDAKERVITDNTAQDHQSQDDGKSVDNRWRHAPLLRCKAPPTPTTAPPITRSTTKTKMLRRCWPISRSICTVGVCSAPRNCS